MKFLIMAMMIALTLPLQTHAEIKFSKIKIKVDKHALEVEVAKTSAELQRGLMFRTELKDGAGMLFIYEKEQPLSFWMKNTFIPLSIGFFDSHKKLIDIQEMSPVVSEMQKNIPTYQSKGPAMYALELPKGWFARNHVQVGAQLSFVQETRP